MPLSTLQATPRDVACKTQGQDGFAASFPVGLFHPLQHAGLSRRTPDCPLLGHNPWIARGVIGYFARRDKMEPFVPRLIAVRTMAPSRGMFGTGWFSCRWCYNLF